MDRAAQVDRGCLTVNNDKHAIKDSNPRGTNLKRTDVNFSCTFAWKAGASLVCGESGRVGPVGDSRAVAH